MSLIQEALRRQQAEFNKEKAVPPPPPPAPAPEPEEPPERPAPASLPPTIDPNAVAAAPASARKPPPRGTLVLLGAFVVTALLFAISGYFLAMAFKASKSEKNRAFSFPVARPSAPAVPAPDETGHPAPVPPAAPARPATGPVMTPRERLADTVKATEEYVKEADTIIDRGMAPEASPKKDIAVVPAPGAAAPAERSPAEPAPAAPRVIVEPVAPSPAMVAAHALPGGAAAQPPAPAAAAPQDNAWPKIALTGTMMKPHGRDSAAMINRTLVGVGESVAGVNILDVRHNSVLVEYQGAKRVLFVGQSTE